MDLPAQLSRRYRIVRLLGQGSQGEVYLARDLECDRDVALKVLTARIAACDDPGDARFADEAALCSRLGKHANIVHLFDHGTEAGLHYTAFEYVDGQTLDKEIAAATRLTPSRTLEVADGILAALELAHESGVTHRDIKPQNIMIRAVDKVPMLMDFGFAKAEAGGRVVTLAGVILGTPAYMSPEIITGSRPHPAMDLYSLGCTLYHCLAGRPPFVADRDLAVLDKQLHETPASLMSIGVRVDLEVERIIFRALQKSPADRFRSATEMREALLAAVSGSAAASSRTVSISRSDAVAGEGRPEVAPRPRAAAASPKGPPSRKIPPGSPPELATRAGLQRPPSRPLQATRLAIDARDRPERGPSAGREGAPHRADRAASGRRLGWVVAAAVLASLAVVGVGAWRFRAGGGPPGVRLERFKRLSFGSSSTAVLELSTLPPPSTRFVCRPAATRQDPAPAVRIHAPAEGHQVVLSGLRPGERYVISLRADPGDAIWSQEFLVPPVDAVRLHCPRGPDGPVRLSVHLEGARDVRLSLEKNQGQSWPAGAAGGRLCVPSGPPFSTLLEGSVLEMARSDDLPIRLRVDPVRALMAGLCESIESLRPEDVVTRLVGDKKHFQAYNYPFVDQMMTGMMGAGEARLHPFTAREGKRKTFAPDGYFRRVIVGQLVDAGIWNELETFRPYAKTVLGPQAGPDELPLRLYEALLRIEPLDLFITSQLDTRNLGIAELYRGLVRADCTVPLREPSPQAPGEISLLEQRCVWVPRGFDAEAWGRLHGTTRADTGLCFTLFETQNPTLTELQRRVQTERTTERILLNEVGKASCLRLDVSVAQMVPNTFLEVLFFSDQDPEAGRIRLLATHPGTPEWHQFMSELTMDGESPWAQISSESRSREFVWGQIRLTFPAWLMPADAVSAKVTWRGLPGARQNLFSGFYHIGLSRQIRLAAASADRDSAGR